MYSEEIFYSFLLQSRVDYIILTGTKQPAHTHASVYKYFLFHCARDVGNLTFEINILTFIILRIACSIMLLDISMKVIAVRDRNVSVLENIACGRFRSLARYFLECRAS